MESIEKMSKDHSSSDSQSDVEKKEGFLDFLWKKDCLDVSSTSMRVVRETNNKPTSKSLASSPRFEKRNLTSCFELPKLSPGDKRRKCTTPSSFVEMKLLQKRRSSTPSSKKISQKRISELRDSGVKTDSENDDISIKRLPEKRCVGSKVICNTPDNIIITETAPSLERFRRYSSSSDDVFDLEYRLVFYYKFSLNEFP